jgi:hypothetical protein
VEFGTRKRVISQFCERRKRGLREGHGIEVGDRFVGGCGMADIVEPGCDSFSRMFSEMLVTVRSMHTVATLAGWKG